MATRSWRLGFSVMILVLVLSFALAHVVAVEEAVRSGTARQNGAQLASYHLVLRLDIFIIVLVL